MSTKSDQDNERLSDIKNLLSQLTVEGRSVDLVETCQVRNIRVISDDIYVRLFLGSDQIHLKEFVQQSLQTLAWVKRVVVDSRCIAGVKRTIAIGSGKGGVGKTSVTVGLALALKQQGFSVGILDADVYGPNVSTVLCSDDSTVETEEISGAHRFIPVDLDGMKIMSVGMLATPDQSLAWRGPILTRLLNQFMYDVNWGELDFLLIDLPPGTGDAQITILQESPVASVMLVGVPGMSSVADLKRTVSMYRQFGLPILGYVENFSSIRCPNCGSQFSFLLDQLDSHSHLIDDIPLLASLPIDPETLSKKSKNILTLNEVHPDSFQQIVHQCMALI